MSKRNKIIMKNCEWSHFQIGSVAMWFRLESESFGCAIIRKLVFLFSRSKDGNRSRSWVDFRVCDLWNLVNVPASWRKSESAIVDSLARPHILIGSAEGVFDSNIFNCAENIYTKSAITWLECVSDNRVSASLYLHRYVRMCAFVCFYALSHLRSSVFRFQSNGVGVKYITVGRKK